MIDFKHTAIILLIAFMTNLFLYYDVTEKFGRLKEVVVVTQVFICGVLLAYLVLIN